MALHEARKAAKRARYAGEAAGPVLGKRGRRLAKRMKAVQSVFGDHQDAVRWKRPPTPSWRDFGDMILPAGAVSSTIH